MKRVLSLTIVVLLLTLNSTSAFAKVYMVNPFYAIKSFYEYEKVQTTLGNNHLYYEWARVARDAGGNMVFTNKNSKISDHDLYKEYYLPEPAYDNRLTNQIHKTAYPGSKNLLAVFFNTIEYTDGRYSNIDFLNMNDADWDKYIIIPMISMVSQYGFDGVVLDFEGFVNNMQTANYIDSQKSNLREKYNRFLTRLKNSLQGKLLGVCVNAADYYDGYDNTFIYNTADYMILLSYPHHHFTTYSESDGVPYLNGKIKELDIKEAVPFDKIKKDIDSLITILKQGLKDKYNSKKILLGATLELRGWVQKEYTYNSKIYTYYENVLSLGNSKFNVSTLTDLENISGTAEYINISSPYNYSSKTYKKTVNTGLDAGMKKIEYFYETPETLYGKYYSLVNEYKLAGISVWRLGIGSAGMWNSLNTIFDTPEGAYEELPAKWDIPDNKTWSVKFNMQIDKSSIKQARENITVINSTGNEMPLRFEFEDTTNSVKVIPAGPYKSGEVYYLIIGKSIKSSLNGAIGRPARMQFKIK